MTTQDQRAAGTTGRPVATAIAVSKSFGATRALIDVGIDVAPGEAHALVGRNGAGKSTLVSLLTGLARPEAGRILFDGEPAPSVSDRAAWQARVACVYQKSTIIPTLSVAENLFLNRQADGLRRISWKALRSRAADLLAEYEIDVDPAAAAATLAVDQRQVLEIARALSFGAKFIILDEPTAQLDGAKIAGLFDRLRRLQESGVAFLFISHHLAEVYEVCQTVTVYRDARHILTAPVAGLDKDALIEAMTGEDRSERAQYAVDTYSPPADTVPALEIRDLTLPGAYSAFSVSVGRGEIVGLAGAGGSGVVALGETVAGLHRPSAGAVAVAGKSVRTGSVPDALHAGLGFVPEDRHAQGVVPMRPIAENITLTAMDRLGRHGFFTGDSLRRAGSALMTRLDVKAEGPDQPVGALSGGNQQKVVMGRALANSPKALVLIRPTAGVDVKSKESLLGTVRQAADEGCGALLVSDELDDLRIAHRVVVMFRGEVVGEFPSGWSDAELIAAVEGLSDVEGLSGPTPAAPAEDQTIANERPGHE
ncbi:simple sugar transport system ATP-binding protein [Catenulispora sp. GAS73]|uniref:sugar ABC transporter ATP-binding protein n=1 Tax=Catenulispora sp. GAS73 TaxID=3156269 RepID=UPI003512FF7C